MRLHTVIENRGDILDWEYSRDSKKEEKDREKQNTLNNLELDIISKIQMQKQEERKLKQEKQEARATLEDSKNQEERNQIHYQNTEVKKGDGFNAIS